MKQLLVVMPDKGLDYSDDQLEDLVRRLLGVVQLPNQAPNQAPERRLKLPTLAWPRADRLKQIEETMPLLRELVKRIFSMELPDIDLPGNLANLKVLHEGDTELAAYTSSEGTFYSGITYAEHPKRPHHYVRLAEFHSELPGEKNAEFIRLVASLGARSVRLKESQEDKVTAEGSIKGDMGIISGHAAEVAGKTAASKSSRFTLAAEFGIPSVKPCLPGNLIWYHEEKEWQSIADGRTGGKWLESYDATFAYEDDFEITGELMAAIEGLGGLGVSAGGKFARFERIVKKIKIDFYRQEDYIGV